MPQVTLTPDEIALCQLELALGFYLRRRDFIACITLAGAAEEILGKLSRTQGKTASLERRAQQKHDLFKHLWPGRQDPGLKPFIALSNSTRNVMKHLITTDPILVDLEVEAGRLLARAVENYTLIFGAETAKMRQFQRQRLRSAFSERDA
jgi:hypothetical protein